MLSLNRLMPLGRERIICRVTLIMPVQYCCCCEWISDKLFASSLKGVSTFLAHTEFVSKQLCWEPSLDNRFLFPLQKGWKDISNDKHMEVDAQQRAFLVLEYLCDFFSHFVQTNITPAILLQINNWINSEDFDIQFIIITPSESILILN